jgi:IMP dehydrogenase
MGSIGAMSSRGKRSFSKDRYFQADVTSDDKIVPEGIEGQVAYRGPVVCRRAPVDRWARPVDVLCRVPGRSRELQERGRFVRITAAGLRESHVHDVIVTEEAPNYRRSE